MDRQQEYLRLLQERNKLKKLLSGKTEEQLQKEELERGFSTHFMGAHATKDQTGKASSRPTVKLHKSPPRSLLRRLVPFGSKTSDVGDGGAQRSHSNGRPMWLKMSAPSENKQRTDINEVDSYDIYESDFEDVKHLSDQDSLDPVIETMQYETNHEFQQRHESDRSDENIYNETVETNYDKLDKEALIGIQPNRLSIGVVDNNKELDHMLVGKIQEMNADQKLALFELLRMETSNNIKTTKTSPERYKHVESQPISTHQIDQNKEEPTAHEISRAETAAIAQNISPAPCDNISLSFSLRIRIHSTYNNSKYCCLQGIRCRVYAYDSTNDDHLLQLDLLPSLPLRISSAFVDLPSTSEPLRTLPVLLGVGTRAKGAHWKAPMSKTSPLELNFKGSISESAASSCLKYFKDENSVRKAMEVLIWNGNINCEELIGASPVKFIDIFLDEKCLWTGELPCAELDVDLTRSSADSFASGLKFESAPSIKLSLSPNGKIETSNEAKSSIVLGSDTSKSGNGHKLYDSISNLKTDLGGNENAEVSNDDKPQWLRGQGLEHKEKIFVEPEEARSLLSESDQVRSSPKKKVSRIQRSRLNKEKVQLDSIPESGIRENESLHERKADENVRRSIDAIEHAEKFNLNRIESVQLFQPNDQTAADTVNLDGSFHAEIPVTTLDPTPVNLNGTDRINKKNVQQAQQQYTDPQREVARIEKFERFSSNLINALSDINNIIATLPRSKSSSRVPTVDDAAVKPLQAHGNSLTDSLSVKQIKPEPMSTCDSTDDMPSGEELVIAIISTHGDANYVGLNGLEIFDAHGKLLSIAAGDILRISAIPSGLEIIPGSEDDPRKVVNLLDGVNETKDDLHQWLAPNIYVAAEYMKPDIRDELSAISKDVAILAAIRIHFSRKQAISCIKVYNLNKSRTHNQRGVKECMIALDGRQIFRG